MSVQRIREHYLENRLEGEHFQEYVQRVGKTELRSLLADLMIIPSYQEDPSFYADWGS